VELAPGWHGWLTKAWEAYGDRSDLAGITLQRPTLINRIPSRHWEIVNSHQPFLYKLLGSIGFSPHPARWREFVDWTRSIPDLDTYDAYVAGLITSEWYKKLDKKSMWTQLFVRFCDDRVLFTLHVNLPGKKTLAAHWREKGEHFGGGGGADFALATSLPSSFPTELVKFGWDGKEVQVTRRRAIRVG
jgi:hypothetical protein